jgi:hypothetical protein
MKCFRRLITAALLGFASTGTLKAGFTNYDFNLDPATFFDGTTNSLILAGSTTAPGRNINNPGAPPWTNGPAGAFNYFWQPSGGTGGAADGFMSIVDAIGNEGLVCCFPYLDFITNLDSSITPTPLRAFRIEMDLRVGNTTNINARAADGFSISFARANDLVISNAIPTGLGGAGVLGGFAGGDSLLVAQATAPGSIDAENGTKTGVSIVFDSWEGNWLPDTPIRAAGQSNDREGIAVRVDDSTLIQVSLTNRNGNCTNVAPFTSPCAAAACTDVNSLQTGAWSPGTTSGSATNGGAYTNLCWQHLVVDLNTTNRLTVIWKGRTIISTNLPAWSPTAGRLILAGRTGGNCQNVHVDNIQITTVPTTNSYLGRVTGDFQGFTFDVEDFGLDHVTNITQVLLDATNDLTSVTTISNFPPGHFGFYSQTLPFGSGSKHTIAVTWQTDLGFTLSGTNLFSVPVYTSLSTNLGIPLSAIDTTKPGFRLKSYQSFVNNPNSIRWTEEMIIGLHGSNVVGAPTVPTESGLQVWDGALDFDNVNGAAPGPGIFPNNYDMAQFGISANYLGDVLHGGYDNSVIELFTYVYFPTSGVYTFVFGTDDSLQVSVASNPLDRMGTTIYTLAGNRLPSPTSLPVAPDLANFYVAQPGCYPMRVLYENGGGNAGLEWYTYNLAAATGTLVNDTNVPGAILTYRAPLTYQPGPYVIKANPVNDSQNAVYYQPIIVDLGDGAGSKTVNTGTIALSVDGNPQGLTISHVGSTTHILQQLTNTWASGAHTNVLTFQDSLGTNYTYTWPFTVIGGVNGVAAADRTNTAIAQVPLSAMVPLGSLSQPGFRIRSHQMYFKNVPGNGTTEEQLEGLHGPNIADQSATNGPGFFVWNNILDFRKVTGAGTAAANAAGEFSFDYPFGGFGINTLQFNSSVNNVDFGALDIEAYLYFPTAGNYILHANTDDLFKLIVPTGNPLGKLGTVLGAFDGGRGMVAAAGGVQTGGTFFQINIPSAGAYPFRMIYANGTGDAGAELSIYQTLPDGSVGKIPINDTGTPGSILAYQVSSAATGPYVSLVNPVPDKRDAVFYQPIVVDLTDGTTTTDPGRIDALTVDGLPFGFSATKAGSVTHIVGNPPSPWAPSTGHTNVLRYHDSASVNYTNTWTWVCTNFSPFGIITIPSSYAVPLSSLDANQPGFRIKSYQTVANNANTIAWTEEMFEGLHGPNIADLSGAVNSNYFSYNGVIEFNNAGTGTSGAGAGEWEYDYPLGPGSGSGGGFGHQNTGGVNYNNDALDIGTYLYFPRAGTYMMELATDDDFRLTVPYGNPFNKFGVYVASVEGGHGTANAGYGPTGRAISYSFVNITTPGAYPFRLLWENAGGGASVEWNVWEYLTNDTVSQVLVGDTNTPGIIKAFQTSTNDTPYVISLFPIPGNVYGSAPAITLAPPPYSVNPFTGATNDLIIQLQDANTTVNGGSVTLSLNGISQPVTVSQAGGITTIVRSNSALPYWPSGQYGQLILTFTDNTGRTITMPLAYVATAFWGTLAEGFPLGVGNPAKRGFYLRTFQADQTGSTATDTRVHAAEQILAGLWTNNMANLASATASLPPPTNKYFVLAGTGGAAGVINFNPARGTNVSDIGDFQSPTNADQLLPGIPGTGTAGNRTNSFVAEFLTYVEFPTNGTYVLGVNSDDGFRLTRGWGAANNNGALVVNSPAVLAGAKATAQNSFLTSLSITSAISGNLVLAQGPFGASNPFGSTNYNSLGYSVDGCVINNAGALNGNIALMYRSVSCGFVQQVQNAAAAGARAVVFVQNRPASEGWFPTEATVGGPVQPIPAVMIKLDDGLKLIAALATNSVNVTLTPMDYLINPPAAESPLGQADAGKGSSDVLFPLVVPQAGIYPLRLLWQQGGGGANCEFFSVVGNNRVLINDDTNPNGPALKAYYGLTVTPSIGLNYNGSFITVTNTGTLQKLADLNTTNWVDIYNDVPIVQPPKAPQQFFRAR